MADSREALNSLSNASCYVKAADLTNVLKGENVIFGDVARRVKSQSCFIANVMQTTIKQKLASLVKHLDFIRKTPASAAGATRRQCRTDWR